MNIVFKRVVGYNFLSLGYCDIELNNQGYVIVDGINNNPDDLAKSNGSGKSAIWEMIVWCLTGETIRGIKSSNIVNIYANDGAYVRLELDINGDHWVLLRSKDHSEYKTNFRIWKDENELSAKGIRDTEKLFAEYFPDLTSSLIGSVMILGQGLPQRFTSNSPSGRKEVLEKLSKSDFMIEDLKTRIKSRSDEISCLIREVEDAELAANTKLDLLAKNLQSYEDQLDHLDDVTNLEATLLNNKQILSLKEVEANSLNSEIDKLEKNIKTYNEGLTIESAKYSEAIVRLTAAEASKRSVVEDQYRDNINNDTSKKATIDAQILSITNEIKRLRAIVDICPTCGQKLIGVEKPDTSKLEQDLEALRVKSKNYNDSITKQKLRMNEALDSAKCAINEQKNIIICTYNENKSKIENSIKDATSILTKNKVLLSTINSDIVLIEKTISKLEADIANYNSKKEHLLSSIEITKANIKDLEDNILYINNNKENLNARAGVISKFNTAITRDFRGILLSALIVFIEERAKKYSLQIFETDKIEFELDGNNISISYNGKQYESLSGGEKQKVDLIVQFSIRDMLCKYLNFGCNILVLDEIFDNLDITGCNKVIELLSSSLNDINSVYVVTHHSDLEIPYDRRIIVEKNENGVSTVRGLL